MYRFWNSNTLFCEYIPNMEHIIDLFANSFYNGNREGRGAQWLNAENTLTG